MFPAAVKNVATKTISRQNVIILFNGQSNSTKKNTHTFSLIMNDIYRKIYTLLNQIDYILIIIYL